jgi:hypothetical protein
MPRPIIRLCGAALAFVAAIGLAACGDSTSAVTRPRLERSLESTFANLDVKQAHLLGHAGVTARSLKPHAFCDKGGPSVADRGPGSDWNCYMYFRDPNVPLTDGTGKFEMNVHSSGCYTAGGSSKVVGLISITDTRGKVVDNPTYEFDGCFDTTGPSKQIPAPGGPPAVVALPTGKVPIDAGVVQPDLKCSAGAVGGCIGVLSAKVGSRTVASTNVQLPPNGDNSFSFPVPNQDRRYGTKVTLRFAPFVGRVKQATSTVTLGPPPPS